MAGFTNTHAVTSGDLGLSGGPKDIGAGIAVIVSDLMLVIGALSVIFIIVGGLRMALSAGNAKQVEEARNTVIYACVGLAVAIGAYAIVSFVTSYIH